jgi:copper chaperone
MAPVKWEGTMRGLTLQIEGMSCGHCLNAVNKALGNLAGVEIGSVTMGRAILQYDPGRIGVDQVLAAVRAEGYEAAVVGGG